ncbi:cache domain-containing protein [Paenarthrobacter sp. AMU7]|uniref:Cache domain-containing protein n=1 Tax=Paenarthrobacter sp. AMU7 TaxID=3162492 RepID=A0AB39YPH7_9MICC
MNNSTAVTPTVLTPVQAVAELDAIVAGIESRIAQWAATTSEWLTGLTGKATGTGLDKFIRPSVELLIKDPDISAAGAGFIANVGLLGPDRSYISWWQGTDMERVDALANFSPTAASRYVKTDWFRIPIETGRGYVTGPYVDFLCTDEYVLTFTHPVRAEGAEQFGGIVGMDMTLEWLERRGLPLLQLIGDRATLVDGEGRSIVSAASHIRAGDLVSSPDHTTTFSVGSRFQLLSEAGLRFE